MAIFWSRITSYNDKLGLLVAHLQLDPVVHLLQLVANHKQRGLTQQCLEPLRIESLFAEHRKQRQENNTGRGYPHLVQPGNALFLVDGPQHAPHGQVLSLALHARLDQDKRIC